jgi:hypothetical protein
MNASALKPLWIFLGLSAFAIVSWLIFLGYLTPEMMVYFLTFRWCL